MKIYHIALLSHGEPNACMTRAMREIGHEVMVMDWQTYLKQHGIDKLRTHIIEDVRAFQPDIVFMQIQTGGIIDIHTADTLSSLSFTINWTGDVRENIDWYIELAPYLGVTLFTNMHDVHRLRAEGLRTDYLQVGYDELIYNLDVLPGKGSNKIVFMGNNYEKSRMRFPGTIERKHMVSYMQTRFGSRFSVFGSGWPGKRRTVVEQEAMIYRGSLIALNQNHFHYEKFSSDRIFRAMACGCFMATKYYPGLEEDFELGKHLQAWSTMQELEDIVRYYLSNDDERREIALAGAQYVRENCTWHSRFKQLDTILEKHGKLA